MRQKIQFISLKIEKLEAILRRVNQNHPARTRAEGMLDTSKAGEWGERSLDFYLDFLISEDHLHFEGTRLLSGRYYFQIDTLLVHPKFILILEVKNLKGTLIFDTDHNQLIQQFDDREIIHKDPIQQVNHQHFRLKQWLEQFRINKDIPIHSYVVVANDHAKIIPKHNGTLLAKKVIRNTKIRDVVNGHFTKHSKEILLKKDLQKMKKLLIKHHTPSNPDLLSKLQITKNDLLTGVQCPGCYSIPMKRIHGQWICTVCRTVSKNAFLSALRDYFLLVNPYTTTIDFKEYLHLESRTTSQRLLSTLNLKHIGSTKNRIYHLDSLWPLNYK